MDTCDSPFESAPRTQCTHRRDRCNIEIKRQLKINKASRLCKKKKKNKYILMTKHIEYLHKILKNDDKFKSLIEEFENNILYINNNIE